MNCLLVGHGKMGRNHERILASIQTVKIVAIIDPIYEESATKNEITFLPHVDLSSIGKIDFAIVASPSTTHLLHGRNLATNQIPTLIEKPVAPTLAESLEIQAVFLENETSCAVGHVERYNPAAVQARLLINQGVIGEIVQVSTHRFGPNPGRILDVGVSLDLLSHDIDLLMWVTGASYESVFCQSWKFKESAFEDSVFVTGRLTNGILVNHIVNWVTPFKRRELLVVGSQGAISIDLLNERVTIHTFDEKKASKNYSYRGENTEISITHEEPLRHEILDFLNLVNKRPSGICTIREATSVIEIIECVLHSAETGQRIMVRA